MTLVEHLLTRSLSRDAVGPIGAGAQVPDGLTEMEEDELGGALHPSEDPDLTGLISSRVGDGWLTDLDRLRELEALTAFGGYAFEHPDDPFPEVVDSSEAFLAAEGLAHPLLAEGAAVRNDVRLGGERRCQAAGEEDGQAGAHFCGE